MTLQELDLHIVHCSGKKNANTDALSRCPLPSSQDSHHTAEVIATVTAVEQGTEDNTDDLAVLQRADGDLSPLIDYQMAGALPQHDCLARKLLLSGSRYTLVDQILYHIEDDSTLGVIPPQTSRRRLFRELHSGKFGAHLSGEKVFSKLRKHYWWEGMRSDVNRWTRSFLICASHGLGRKTRPPLSPIPVLGAFDRISVDVLQLPKTCQGNKYAIVFVDYLTKWREVYPTPYPRPNLHHDCETTD